MKRKNMLMIVLGVFALVIVTTGASFAFFQYQRTGNTKVNVTSGAIQFSYLEDNQNASLVNAFPVADSVGAIDITGEYEFTVNLTSSAQVSTKYNVILVSDNNDAKNYFTNDQIKFALVKNNTYVADTSSTKGVKLSELSGFTSNSSTGEGLVLSNQNISAGQTDTYKLRIWISDDVSYNNDITDGISTGKYNGYTYSLKVKVATTYATTAINYKDESGANTPDLASNMIPVTYDGTNWIKADTTKKWYDYNEQWWANAVTVSEANRTSYMNASVGTPISMDDINTMWVWIPRYEYENITSTTATEIKVNFLNGTASDKTANYYTHPAFTFGEEELIGIWVAKFETSSGSNCTATSGDINKGCDITTLAPIVKPNVTSWRGIRTSTAFTVSRNMENSNNIYGFVASEVDTHMMKNTEWGAATYLSQSKYGKYGNLSYSEDNKEIYQNKSNLFITGMSNGTPSSSTSNTQVTYNVEGAGTGASTTGNIYGIYDMSGGAWEYMMGIMQDNTNTPMSGNSTALNSGFTGKIYVSGSFTQQSGIAFPESKYYDLYKYGTSANDYTRNIKGDATIETKGWYADLTYFAIAVRPWLSHGGYYNDSTTAGVFSLNSYYGSADINSGFRLTLIK